MYWCRDVVKVVCFYLTKTIKVARLQTSTTFTDEEGNTTTVSDQGVKYGYEFYVDGIKKASIADIASDDIESIEVDKQDPNHPKVYITLKK